MRALCARGGLGARGRPRRRSRRAFARAAAAPPGSPGAAGIAPPGDEAPPYDASWFSRELEGLLPAATRAEYAAECAAGAAAVVAWRRRYAGDRALWQRLTRRDKRGNTKCVKELAECLPVLRQAAAAINQLPLQGGERATVLDLCSGKGYLAMFLADGGLVDAERVERITLVDSAFPPLGGDPQPHHIHIDHLAGVARATGLSYAASAPIRLDVTKRNLKKRRQLQQLLERHVLGATGPVVILAVHLCGTLALRAVDLFNDGGGKVTMLALKPCCLPAQVPDELKLERTFTIGTHQFPASEVTARGKWVSRSAGNGKTWQGPPRAHLEPRFERWAAHLLRGMEVGEGGERRLERVQVQAESYQNVFLFARRANARDVAR